MSQRIRYIAVVLALAVAAVAASFALSGAPSAQAGETKAQAQKKCQLETSSFCTAQRLPQVNSTCTVFRPYGGSGPIKRTWGCPGSPKYVY